jgi:hypothetical protein
MLPLQMFLLLEKVLLLCQALGLLLAFCYHCGPSRMEVSFSFSDVYVAFPDRQTLVSFFALCFLAQAHNSGTLSVTSAQNSNIILGTGDLSLQ